MVELLDVWPTSLHETGTGQHKPMIEQKRMHINAWTHPQHVKISAESLKKVLQCLAWLVVAIQILLYVWQVSRVEWCLRILNCVIFWIGWFKFKQFEGSPSALQAKPLGRHNSVKFLCLLIQSFLAGSQLISLCDEVLLDFEDVMRGFLVQIHLCWCRPVVHQYVSLAEPTLGNRNQNWETETWEPFCLIHVCF